jgi:hypothetical protein
LINLSILLLTTLWLTMVISAPLFIFFNQFVLQLKQSLVLWLSIQCFLHIKQRLVIILQLPPTPGPGLQSRDITPLNWKQLVHQVKSLSILVDVQITIRTQNITVLDDLQNQTLWTQLVREGKS